jgi:ribosomal protein S21
MDGQQTIGMSRGGFERALKKFKKDFDQNVMPSIRRHKYARSSGQARRLKHRQALQRMRKAERKRLEARAGGIWV